jgi:septum formation protein
MTRGFSHMTELILASTSPYRQEQLKDFGLQFRSVAPLVDEDALKAALPKKSRTGKKICVYLAQEKARSVAALHPSACVLGADQLVELNGHILGKPKTREGALAMLTKMQGRTHNLITSLVLITPKKTLRETVVVKIKMRRLSRNEILEYIYRDNPLDCAGSYKFEKSGLSLIEKMNVSDPSALIGLPLISLVRLFKKAREPIPFKRALPE